MFCSGISSGPCPTLRQKSKNVPVRIDLFPMISWAVKSHDCSTRRPLCHESRPMVTNPILVNALQPVERNDLARLGSANDGGYVVPLDAVKNAKALVSFGLRFDWNFERDFQKLNPNAVI